MAQNASARTPGQLVAGKYRLEEPIARGGMGSVWRATDAAGAPVALKFVEAQRGGRKWKSALARFELEAHAAQAIAGPNVVSVIEHGHDDDSPYIAMELLRGASLAQRLERGALSLDEAKEIVVQTCAALGRAHALGFIHRDLKPENLFLCEGEPRTVKVLDFGLAKDATAAVALTGVGELVGTLDFMSPEQARGRAVDPRTDLYSLGVVVFRCLTGRLPYEKTSPLPELVISVVEREPALASVYRPDLPVRVVTWIGRALQKDPRKRFESAAEMSAAFVDACVARRTVITTAAAVGEPPVSSGGREATLRAEPSDDRTLQTHEPAEERTLHSRPAEDVTLRSEQEPAPKAAAPAPSDAPASGDAPAVSSRGASASATMAPLVIERPAHGRATSGSRYAVYDAIASGGMATVHLGRLLGPVGFSRTVAIKRLHAQFARDPEFVAMFLDEARLAARIQHPNVVPTLDVVATQGELFLVMEYVRGESASRLARAARDAGERVPARVVAAIVSGALQGLHAAHEAKDESGLSLGIVHRDVSPQNVLVGLDGTARVLDFGVAKAEDKFHATQDGQLKGKLVYMPPEQLEGREVDRTADVYAMGTVLFELLTGRKMFSRGDDKAELARIVRGEITLPSEVDASLAPWDAVVARACRARPADRYATAKAMAHDVEAVAGVASASDVADWMMRLAGPALEERNRRVVEIESSAQLDRAELQAALHAEIGRAPSTSGSLPAAATPSQVSVVGPTPRSPAGRPVVWAAVGAAAVVLLGVAFLLGRAHGDSTPASPSTTPSAHAPEPTATTSASAAPSAAPAVPSASAGATSAPPAADAGAAVTRPPKRCDPPYTLDAKGHKHFKPECL